MIDDLTFVTGATGFLGSHVARRLLLRGDRVRIFARNSSRKSNIEGLGCEVVTGDLKNMMSLVRCVQGCRRVYHVAADYRLWARNPDEIYESNVAGTRNLLSACCEAGVEKVVYTSTAGTIGPPNGDLPADEETPVSLDHMTGHYLRSKFMAEQVAREFAASGLPLVIVNPTVPVGAGDIRPTPMGRMILDFIRGRMPAYVEATLNIVCVDDVAQGHLLAEEKGRQGEGYILGGEDWGLEEILDTLARISGRLTPRIRIPRFVALGAAYLDDFVMGTLMRREPTIPLDVVKTARRGLYVSSERARRDLDYRTRSVEQGLREAVEYFLYEWRPDSAQDRVSNLRPKAV